MTTFEFIKQLECCNGIRDWHELGCPKLNGFTSEIDDHESYEEMYIPLRDDV